MKNNASAPTTRRLISPRVNASKRESRPRMVIFFSRCSSADGRRMTHIQEFRLLGACFIDCLAAAPAATAARAATAAVYSRRFCTSAWLEYKYAFAFFPCPCCLPRFQVRFCASPECQSRKNNLFIAAAMYSNCFLIDCFAMLKERTRRTNSPAGSFSISSAFFSREIWSTDRLNCVIGKEENSVITGGGAGRRGSICEIPKSTTMIRGMRARAAGN